MKAALMLEGPHQGTSHNFMAVVLRQILTPWTNTINPILQ